MLTTSTLKIIMITPLCITLILTIGQMLYTMYHSEEVVPEKADNFSSNFAVLMALLTALGFYCVGLHGAAQFFFVGTLIVYFFGTLITGLARALSSK